MKQNRPLEKEGAGSGWEMIVGGCPRGWYSWYIVVVFVKCRVTKWRSLAPVSDTVLLSSWQDIKWQARAYISISFAMADFRESLEIQSKDKRENRNTWVFQLLGIFVKFAKFSVNDVIIVTDKIFRWPRLHLTVADSASGSPVTQTVHFKQPTHIRISSRGHGPD